MLARSVLLAIGTFTMAARAGASSAPATLELSATNQTLVDMQIVHLLLTTYARERGALPATGDAFESIALLSVMRQPFFAERSSGVDGWGRPLLYWSDGERYLLLSTGPDGRRDELVDPLEMLGRDFRPAPQPNDIVLRDGYVAQLPPAVRSS